VLTGDFARVRTQPSRLRGTYRVTMSGGDSSVTWEFRTVDPPAYRVPEWEDSRTLDDLLASPYSSGYSMVGYPADSTGTLPLAAPRPDPRATRALVWLKAGDRLTSPEARGDSVLTGELEFTRAAVPPAIWRALDAFVRPVDSLTLAVRARTGRTWTDGDDQAALPITIRVTGAGGVRGDTTLVRGASTLRVGIVRIDTVAVRRPF
jgi:hypothetical protein